MKGRLRIWGWEHPEQGGAGKVPMEMEGLRNCTWERAKGVLNQLDITEHYAEWKANHWTHHREWGSKALQAHIVWDREQRRKGLPPSVASLDKRRISMRRST